MKVLFVCTGNVCRSPTAERLAMAYATRAHFLDFTASSAGTHALAGRAMEVRAAQVLEKLGGDPSDFAARQLSRTIAADADLVLTMTGKHRDHVLRFAPQQLRKTFVLREAARLISDCGARSIADLSTFRSQLGRQGDPNIPDPMGHDEVFFATVGAQIAELLPAILELCQRG